MRYVDVAIATPLHRVFTYSLTDEQDPAPGMRLAVPFRRQHVVGICMEIREKAPEGFDPRRIKSVLEVLDEEPSLTPSILRLMTWMSAYYLAPIGEVCRTALPRRMMRLGGPKTTRPTSPREIQSISEKEIILNDCQRVALDAIIAAANAGEPKTFLLHGITGSGKTEIYLRFFAELAKSGRRGLLLVPEIGLTPQLTARATARFGNGVAIYHSGLTEAQRHDQWLRIRRGQVNMVIGTRSALFAPLPELGAIVIDEEHDGSYKQDEGFAYHARDAAVMRAHIEGITTVLGSATPSLESTVNVQNGKYEILQLPNRTGEAFLPHVEIVDMRKRQGKKKNTAESEGMKRCREFHSLSPALYDAISETLSAGDKVLLYVGRRGFASSIQCGACGEVFCCPNCDIALTAHGGIHSTRNFLSCHYCDYKIPMPSECKSCDASDLIPIGLGTERLEAEISDFFPNARLARLDSDMASKPKARQKIFDDMRRGKTDILIGTQMITKGHDFPSITLVGVVSADLSLAIPDFRSAERTFQLITQVAGRAGRGAKPGRVIIQTRQPGHYSFIAAREHNCDMFASKELEHRREMEYPPFARIANIRLSSTKRETASRYASDVAKMLRQILDGAGDKNRIRILGPAPATIEKLRGRYRWQMLIKAPTSGHLTKFLTAARPGLTGKIPSGVRLSIDVDPVNML